MPPLPSRTSIFVAPIHIVQSLVQSLKTHPVHRFVYTRSASPRAFSSMAPTVIKKYDYVVIGGGSGGSGYALFN